jgi:glucosamine--fructose-6-phosphate aminotransferase (isomerizing)
VEIASEYRYRAAYANPKHLIVTISQSGETLDTMEALKYAKALGHKHTLSICNVPESAIPRASELVCYTRAGAEIGVASTKAFTTQLAALFQLTVVLGKLHGRIDAAQEADYLEQLRFLPGSVQHALNLEPQIAAWAERFARKQCAVPGPWPALPDRAGRRAQAQGNLLHPRRGLPGGRAEARPAGAGGRGHAGGGDRPNDSCWKR